MYYDTDIILYYKKTVLRCYPGNICSRCFSLAVYLLYTLCKAYCVCVCVNTWRYLLHAWVCLTLSASSFLCVVTETESAVRRTCQTQRRSRNRLSRTRRCSARRQRSDPYQGPGSALVSWCGLDSFPGSRYPHGASRSVSPTEPSLSGHCGGNLGASVLTPSYGYPQRRTNPSLSGQQTKTEGVLLIHCLHLYCTFKCWHYNCV